MDKEEEGIEYIIKAVLDDSQIDKALEDVNRSIEAVSSHASSSFKAMFSSLSPGTLTQTPSPAANVFRPKGTDTIPAMLTPGEEVINRDSAESNRALLQAINASRGPVESTESMDGRAEGGTVYAARGTVPPSSSSMISAMSSSGSTQAEEIAKKRHQEDILARMTAFSAIKDVEDASLAALKVRTDLEERLKEDLISQRDVLVKTQQMSLIDGDLLKQKLALEKDITEARQRYSILVAKEQTTPEAIRERLKIEQEIASIRHEEAMLELQEASKPEILSTRVAQEREIAEARKEAALASQQEYIKQAGGPLGYAKERMTSTEGVKSLMGAAQGGNALGTAGSMAGGAIGEALGGPIGEMLGEMVGKKLAEAIPDSIAAPAKLVRASLDLVAQGLHGLQGTLGPIGAGFDFISSGAKSAADAIKGIPIIGEVLGPLVDSLAAIPAIFKDITETLVSFAAKASPGQFKMFSMAVEDVQGVIGQTFLPILELMREAIRLVGDTLATVLPNYTETRDAIAGFRDSFATLLGTIRETMADIGPILRDVFIYSLKVLNSVLIVVTSTISGLIKGCSMLLSPLTGLLNLFGIGLGGMRSSVGAAARPAHFSGIEEYQKQLQVSAFSEPGSIKNAMPRNVLDIRNILEQMLEWTKLLTPLGIAEATAKALAGFLDPHGVRESVKGGVKGFVSGGLWPLFGSSE